MKLFQRFTLLALIAGVLGSALVMGCGGGSEDTDTTAAGGNNAAAPAANAAANDAAQ